MIKRILPRSLLGRSILIIVTPLILLQLVSGFVFYESHWDKVSLRLARGLAGDIAAVVELLHVARTEPARARIYRLAAQNMAIVVRLRAGEIMENLPETAWKRLCRRVKHEVKTTPRARPTNVKEQVIKQREFKNIRLVDEYIAEFQYSPTLCKKTYRVVVPSNAPISICPLSTSLRDRPFTSATPP